MYMWNGQFALEVSTTIEQNVLTCKQHKCKVYLCMICPRKDGDVIPVNDGIKQMSELHGVNYMNIYGAFTFIDRSVATHFYYRDGVHLNNTGTVTLVRSINNVVPIIKKNTNRQQNINQTWNFQRHQYMRNQHQYSKRQTSAWRTPYNRIGSDYSRSGYSRSGYSRRSYRLE